MKIDVDFYPRKVEIYPHDLAASLPSDATDAQIAEAVRDDLAVAISDDPPTLILRDGDIAEAVKKVREALAEQSKED